MNGRYAHNGFSMIETLVTLIIVAVGLLGLAGLQSRAHQAEFESYQRSQALVLLSDMVNRINANRAAAGCYDLPSHQGSTFVGAGNNAAFACDDYGVAANQAIAESDVLAWHNLLRGAAEQAGDGSQVGAMVGARGCIDVDPANPDRFIVAVAWQGLSPTIAPTSGCASGLYGDDRLRRVVTATVTIANLL